MSLLTIGGRAILLGASALAFGTVSSGSGNSPSPGTGAAPLPLTLAVRGNVLPTTANDTPALWCVYSGGIGPFTFSFAGGATTAAIGGSAAATMYLNAATGTAYISAGLTAVPASQVDTLSLIVTDSTGATAEATWTQTYTAADAIVLSTDFFFTNQPPSSYDFIGISPFLADYDSSATCSYVEPSGLLTVQWVGVNGGYVFVEGDTWPPAGAYPLTLTISEGSKSYTYQRTIYIVDEAGPAFIEFVPAPILSTSLPAGFVAGQANASDADNSYVWSVSPQNAGNFVISNLGVVSLIAAPGSAGPYELTLLCTDGSATYSQTFTLTFVAGVTLPAMDITAAVPQDLDNSVSSGILTTPSVISFEPTLWLLQGNYGVGTRYAVDALTGVVSIIGALSYQVAADGADFTDQLTLIATDGINTCSLSFAVPVAMAQGPTIAIGPPDILSANGVTGASYATLTAAFDALGAHEPSTSNDIVAGTIFEVWSPPQTDNRYFSYFENDGPNFDHGYGAGGVATLSKPITIMGAPGQPFPYFWSSVGTLAKGQFAGQNFDLVLKNLTVAKATRGDGYGNICGIYKDAGVTTGNLIVDNCYIHDCDDGISRGSVGSKVLLTRTRISHCGVGSNGLTHNIYIECDLFYAASILSDHAFNGHLLKTRSQNTIVQSSRLIDGHLGCASNVIDIPLGGVSNVIDCFLHKGPNGQNPFMIKFADPNDQAQGSVGSGRNNVLTVTNNTFVLDPGQPGLGNIMPGMTTSCAGLAEVIGILNASFPGAATGVPANVNASGNSFLSVLAANYAQVADTQGAQTIAAGTNTLSASTALTPAKRPTLDFSFPGPGPDPTVLDPPGPFLRSWVGEDGGVGGCQFTAPIDTMTLCLGAPSGAVVGQVVWSAGNSAITSPAFAINYQSGPNAFAIDPSTGIITTTATAVAQTTQADVIGVTASGGGEEYVWNFSVAVRVPPLFSYFTPYNNGTLSQNYIDDFTATVNTPGLAGVSFALQVGDILSGTWTDLQRVISLVPAGFLFHITLLGQTIQGGTFATVTLPITDSGSVVETVYPVIWDPAYMPMVGQALALLKAELQSLGVLQNLAGIALGLISRNAFSGEFCIPANNSNPYQDLSSYWTAAPANYTPAVLYAAMIEGYELVNATFPGIQTSLCIHDPTTSDVGAGQNGDGGTVSLALTTNIAESLAPRSTRFAVFFDSLHAAALGAWSQSAYASVGTISFQTQVSITGGSFPLSSIPAALAQAVPYNPLWIEVHPNQVPAMLQAMAAL